jgi:pentatricopeptide repeat protein
MSAPLSAIDPITQIAKTATEAMKSKDWETAANLWLQCLERQQVTPRADHQAQLVACYVALKRFEDARLWIERATLKHPFSSSLLMKRAALAYRERDYRVAIESWCLCLALNPGSMSPVAYLRLSKALRRLEFTGHANKFVAQGLRQFPKASALYVEMAQTEDDSGRLQVSGELWEKALEHYQGTVPVPVYVSACRVWAKNKQFKRCVAILEKALVEHPGDRRLLGKLSEARIADRVDVLTVANSEEKYRFTYYKQKQGASIIFFTFGTILADLSSRAFGYPFLISEGYDHVHVGQGPSQQYQELSLEEFAAIAEPLCKGKRAFTYGSSLGGYAAIYFASVIRACAIASSPTLPAHAMANRFPHHKIPIKHIPIEEFETSEKVYAFFDPNDEDDEAFMRQRIAPACKSLIAIPLPFSGHQALRILVEAGLLKQTIRQIVADLPETISIGEDQISSTSIYLDGYSSHLFNKGQYREAIEIGRKCSVQSPRLRVFNVLIRSALKLGQVDEATRYYHQAVESYPAGKVAKLPINPREVKRVQDSP